MEKYDLQWLSVNRRRVKVIVPYDGIWFRLSQTLETTVRRSAYAQGILSPQQFYAARACWTAADLIFLPTALELLYRTDGQVRMSTLAAHCGLSLRQCERRFKQRIVILPKVFARLLRFEALLTSLIREGNLSFTESAAWLGYQDQAHAIHEFRSWAGCTPMTFLARARQRAGQLPLIPDPRPAYKPVYIL